MDNPVGGSARAAESTMTIRMHAPDPSSVVVRPTGEIDMRNLPELELCLVAQLRTHEKVLLDLRDVTFFAARGLRALEDATQLAPTLHAELQVLAPRKHPVAQMVKLFALDESLPLRHVEANTA
jgi:anti-anti-sigma factor